jgi:uncharacterized membrane protein
VNPFRFLRLYGLVSRVLTLLQSASASYAKEGAMSRSLFVSKTFWLNFLTAAVEVTGALSDVIPPGALTLVLAGLNVAIRIITNGPVHVLTQAGERDDA